MGITCTPHGCTCECDAHVHHMGVTCTPHWYYMHTTLVSHIYHMGAGHYIKVVNVQTRREVFAKDAVNEIGSICEVVWHMGIIATAHGCRMQPCTPHGYHMHTTWVPDLHC